MKINSKKKINLSAESKNLIKVRDFVVKFGRKMGLLPKQVSELKLAVDEAVVGACKISPNDTASSLSSCTFSNSC